MTQGNNNPHINGGGNGTPREGPSKPIREDFERLVRLFRKNGIVYAPSINASVHRGDSKEKR